MTEEAPQTGQTFNGNPNPAAPAKLRRKERQAAALALRLQGGSYRKIAETLRAKGLVPKSYHGGKAHADVMAALAEFNTQLAEEAEKVRRLELERLDVLLAALWPKASGKTVDYFAFDRVLMLMDRRARYLNLYKQEPALGSKDNPLYVMPPVTEMVVEHPSDGGDEPDPVDETSEEAQTGAVEG
ncbi:MAG: hypothetical protein C4551_10160 [Bacillota bacterium]|jgi:hypothetical protein|nr:MAG: hypothetical protein C4551_10160 [Bacillota bacterium]